MMMMVMMRTLEMVVVIKKIGNALYKRLYAIAWIKLLEISISPASAAP